LKDTQKNDFFFSFGDKKAKKGRKRLPPSQLNFSVGLHLHFHWSYANLPHEIRSINKNHATFTSVFSTEGFFCFVYLFFGAAWKNTSESGGRFTVKLDSCSGLGTPTAELLGRAASGAEITRMRRLA